MYCNFLHLSRLIPSHQPRQTVLYTIIQSAVIGTVHIYAVFVNKYAYFQNRGSSWHFSDIHFNALKR